MDAKELQAHILNNYGKSILEMGFVELTLTLREINDALRHEYEKQMFLEMQEEEQARIDREQIELAQYEQWEREINEDLQREIDEYHQMTEDDRDFPL